ncbi:putative acyl carrier protein [Propionibacterium acidifaciens F0233]|uniref:Acyl carrier protein n=2 Tax=Propionibacterium acidifaciens TaxID=556499 RepID=U2S944_9ACTN|nr:putative acyl carrier protein [Propionibacterium acidifaciens F0233]
MSGSRSRHEPGTVPENPSPEEERGDIMSTTVRPSGVRQQAEARMARNFRLKEQIINRLGLDTTPEVVSDNQPLFGRGLEMDSLDTLEVVVMVNNEFGVSINDDDAKAFGSINAMADHIEANEVR